MSSIMNETKILHILFILLIEGIAVQIFTSCSSDDKDGDGGGGGNGEYDGELICNDGQAWWCNSTGYNFVFRSNGEGFNVKMSDGKYYVDKKFTWFAKENQLTLITAGNSVSYAYSVSSNQLTIEDVEDAEKDEDALICARINGINPQN